MENMHIKAHLIFLISLTMQSEWDRNPTHLYTYTDNATGYSKKTKVNAPTPTKLACRLHKPGDEGSQQHAGDARDEFAAAYKIPLSKPENQHVTAKIPDVRPNQLTQVKTKSQDYAYENNGKYYSFLASENMSHKPICDVPNLHCKSEIKPITVSKTTHSMSKASKVSQNVYNEPASMHARNDEALRIEKQGHPIYYKPHDAVNAKKERCQVKQQTATCQIQNSNTPARYRRHKQMQRAPTPYNEYIPYENIYENSTEYKQYMLDNPKCTKKIEQLQREGIMWHLESIYQKLMEDDFHRIFIEFILQYLPKPVNDSFNSSKLFQRRCMNRPLAFKKGVIEEQTTQGHSYNHVSNAFKGFTMSDKEIEVLVDYIYIIKYDPHYLPAFVVNTILDADLKYTQFKYDLHEYDGFLSKNEKAHTNIEQTQPEDIATVKVHKEDTVIGNCKRIFRKIAEYSAPKMEHDTKKDEIDLSIECLWKKYQNIKKEKTIEHCLFNSPRNGYFGVLIDLLEKDKILTKILTLKTLQFASKILYDEDNHLLLILRNTMIIADLKPLVEETCCFFESLIEKKIQNLQELGVYVVIDSHTVLCNEFQAQSRTLKFVYKLWIENEMKKKNN